MPLSWSELHKIVRVSSCDSGQNSMEYWDYSVEIECLKGPQGCCVSYYKETFVTFYTLVIE